VSGEVQEGWLVSMQARSIGIPADDHRLNVIVEDLVRHAAEEVEGAL
jgi:ribosomal protein L13E